MTQTTKVDSPKEFVGTWEEIKDAHPPELAGRRVRVIVLPDSTETPSNSTPLWEPCVWSLSFSTRKHLGWR